MKYENEMIGKLNSMRTVQLLLFSDKFENQEYFNLIDSPKRNHFYYIFSRINVNEFIMNSEKNIVISFFNIY